MLFQCWKCTLVRRIIVIQNYYGSSVAMQCNESMIQNCYVNFEQNSSKTCQNVHKLRFCILILRPKGCHEMRNPWHTLAIGIIKSYKSCFIQNYTILLETLDQKRKGMADLTRYSFSRPLVHVFFQ